MNFEQIFLKLKEYFLSGAFDFLQDIDEDALSPLCVFLNIDKDSLSNLLKVLPPLFKGEINLKDAFIYILPVIVSFLLSNKLNKQNNLDNNSEPEPKNLEKQAYSQTFEENKSTMDDIKPIVDNDIYYSLNCYLQS